MVSLSSRLSCVTISLVRICVGGTGDVRLLHDNELDYQFVIQNRGGRIWASVKTKDSPHRETRWKQIGESLSPLLLDLNRRTGTTAETKSSGKAPSGSGSSQSSARSPGSPGGGLVHLRDKETCLIT